MSTITPIVIRRRYPRELKLEGHEFRLHLMSAADADTVVAFGQAMPEEDLTFLRLDITQPDVVAEWVRNIELGRVVTLLATEDERLAGYVSLWHNEFLWTSHLGDIRTYVATPFRESSLAKALVMEAVELADEMNLERVACHIAAEQIETRQMLDELGFNTEALLQDWLKSADGRHHDLMILSRPVEETVG